MHCRYGLSAILVLVAGAVSAAEPQALRVTAPPADGAANAAVLRLLAAALDIAPRNLSLLRGASARIKLIGVAPD